MLLCRAPTAAGTTSPTMLSPRTGAWGTSLRLAGLGAFVTQLGFASLGKFACDRGKALECLRERGDAAAFECRAEIRDGLVESSPSGFGSWSVARGAEFVGQALKVAGTSAWLLGDVREVRHRKCSAAKFGGLGECSQTGWVGIERTDCGIPALIGSAELLKRVLRRDERFAHRLLAGSSTELVRSSVACSGASLQSTRVVGATAPRPRGRPMSERPDGLSRKASRSRLYTSHLRGSIGSLCAVSRPLVTQPRGVEAFKPRSSAISGSVSTSSSSIGKSLALTQTKYMALF
jgi:hypothetical protein